ncbi:MAG: peptidoglycan DD-metalloendopeptidase family protein [Anderseniella sp.]|jgi:murein DD-endopeptidase MepM/ murein hydrolase activator NlpD|nr:peptidoglycan DD-metalloendopeptidase family protein [Anderseniella sp.]
MRHPRRQHGRRKQRGLFSRIGYAFRERQIYLRSEGEVQFITLRPWVQLAAVACFLAGLFWVAYATVNVAFKDQILALKERDQYRARLEYEDRIGGLRATIDQLNRRLLLDQKAYLAKVDEVRAEHDRLVERHDQLAAFFQNNWLPAPRSGNNPAGTGARGDQQKQGSLTALPLASQAYRADFATREQVVQPLADLRRYMSGMETREAGLLQDVVSYMESRNAEISAVYRGLGVNASDVAASSSYVPEGVGGPYIAAASQMGSTLVASRVNALSQELETWERLKFHTSRLPLSRPMPPEHEMSSGFGLRKDPFKRRPAMHAGVDFRGPVGSPVKTPAPGVVSKAGWNGGYGKLVEVRHENGITTRYAHLSIILVRAGQKVKAGDIVGKLGNTGRSTGPHLHYETRVSGRAIDPLRFWKAHDVFQEITR